MRYVLFRVVFFFICIEFFHRIHCSFSYNIHTQWPDDAVETVLADFDDPNHNHDSSLNNSVGDRRQEIVMIGTFASDTKTNICKLLDKCLLTNEEWDEYKQKCEDETKLTESFPSNVDFRMVSY